MRSLLGTKKTETVLSIEVTYFWKPQTSMETDEAQNPCLRMSACHHSEVASIFFFNNWNLRAPANLDPFVLSWTKLFLVASSVLKPKIRTDSNSLQQSGFLPCSPSHSCPRNPLISRWSSARRRKIGQRGEYVAQARVRALNLPAQALVSPIRTSPLHRWSSLLSSVDTSGVSNKRRSSTSLHSCSIEATASWLFMTITHPPGWIESPWVYGDQLPRRGIDSQ